MSDVYELLRYSDLGLAEAALLMALDHLADERGICSPSYADLLAITRMNRRTLIGAIEVLEGEGWITVEREVGANNVYFITDHPVQKCAKCITAPTPSADLHPVEGRKKERTKERKKEERKKADFRPSEVTPESFDALLQNRKSKRMSGFTAYAWKLFVNEATKVGMTAQQAVDFCVTKGWASFRADYWNNTHRQVQPKTAVKTRTLDDLF